MKNQSLSDPITMRVPRDVLAQIEEIASISERSRSWVIVRALKAYLAAEGKEIREIASARRAIEDGEGFDLDTIIDEAEATIKGAAA
ncbi:putative transcriptional regulator [Ochrobactrum daejeonense]|uniref:Putative transcriptional regulator n=1 Tax=Brucella daejeonensis TaxID=659015 RepID=A0A7W9B1J7_9HYPH|nr:ribbon-helix-helix protein, CopG family [Brucella daejeonensis]MBB5704540.1 putative transcriptional regulator [Brucella daejeonensis]NKB78674.1 ribbon-helix-helix protein, CopG family [Brucella daejeonensis]